MWLAPSGSLQQQGQQRQQGQRRIKSRCNSGRSRQQSGVCWQNLQHKHQSCAAGVMKQWVSAHDQACQATKWGDITIWLFTAARLTHHPLALCCPWSTPGLNSSLISTSDQTQNL